MYKELEQTIHYEIFENGQIELRFTCVHTGQVEYLTIDAYDLKNSVDKLVKDYENYKNN